MTSVVLERSSSLRQSLLALGCALVLAVPLGVVYGEHSSTDEGHSSGHSGGESGGHSGGKSSGHGSGKGPRHKGHASGAHDKGDVRDTTTEQFGGGHGLSGHHSVPEGIGRYGSDRPTSDDFGRARFWGGAMMMVRLMIHRTIRRRTMLSTPIPQCRARVAARVSLRV